MRIRALAGLGAWALGDQLLSSGTNFLVGIVIARSLGPEGFGSFTLAFGAWLVMWGFLRAFITQPYTMTASGLAEREWREDTACAAGAQLVLGLAAGVILVSAGLAVGLGGPTGSALVAVGIFASPLALQDFWRFVAFSRRAPRRAFVNDGSWAIVQAVMLAILIASDTLTTATAISAWGVGALAGAIVGTIQFRMWPTPGGNMRLWMRRHAALGGWMALATGIYSVSSYAVLIMLSRLGRSAVGGMRATMSLFAPAQLAATSSESIMLPAAVRMVQNGERQRLLKACIVYSVSLAGTFGVAGGALLLAGPIVFQLVFGSEFTRFVTLVAPVLVQTVATGLTSGASVGIRALADGRRMAALQVFASASRVVLVAAMLPYGLTSTAWGIAVADTASAGFAWFLFRSALRRYQSSDATPVSNMSIDVRPSHLGD